MLLHLFDRKRKMVEVFLYSSQVIIVALLGLMTYRIHNLYQSHFSTEDKRLHAILSRFTETKITVEDNYETKMDSLQKAQMFAGIQMLEIKKCYGDLHQPNLAWLREAISLYLIGSVDYIGKHARCSAATRKELIKIVLKSNLKVSSDISSQYFSEALYRKLSSENDLMVRAGAKAAKSWLSDQKVPNELSLSTQLNDWGVFA
jgi:hypothetical protein